jgi:hypothetical protein
MDNYRNANIDVKAEHDPADEDGLQEYSIVCSKLSRFKTTFLFATSYMLSVL